VLKILNKRTGLVAAFIATLVLLSLVAKPLPRPKVRAGRLQTVNNIAPPFPERTFVLTKVVVTNASPMKPQ
jgi:hypothetical protein